MSEHIQLRSLCPYTEQAESAIVSLKRLGFATKDISVFGGICQSKKDVAGLCIKGGHCIACGGPASFWERMWDFLGDGGFFIVPRIGAIAVAGRFVTDLAAAVDNNAVCSALTALGEAMCRLGIAKENAYRYELEIQVNGCALLAVGTRAQVATAKTVLYSLGVSDFTTGRESSEHSDRHVLEVVSQS